MNTRSQRLISIPLRTFALFVGLVVPFLSYAQSTSSDAQPTDTISTDQFAGDVTGFLGKELSAHLADVRTLEPPQERVVGALTVGEFSWGTFLRALASYSELSGNRSLGGRDLSQL